MENENVGASGVIVGRHDVPVDAGGTFALPEEWRFALTEGRQAYLMPDSHRKCIDLVPKATLEHEVEYLRAQAANDPAAKEMLKALGESACLVRADEDWRITIPASLRKHAGIAETAVLTGGIRIVRIWSPGAFSE